MKENKEIYVDFIIGEIDKGNVSYKDVVSEFCGKFRLSEKSFDKYWKMANEAHKERRQLIETAKIGIVIATEKEAVKRAILDKHEVLEILSEIALGRPKKIEGQIILPSANERRAAIETMAKFQGWFAPTKLDHTSNGKEITNKVIIYDNGRGDLEDED